MKPRFQSLVVKAEEFRHELLRSEMRCSELLRPEKPQKNRLRLSISKAHRLPLRSLQAICSATREEEQAVSTEALEPRRPSE